jgi:hypothetical protein
MKIQELKLLFFSKKNPDLNQDEDSVFKLL